MREVSFCERRLTKVMTLLKLATSMKRFLIPIFIFCVLAVFGLGVNSPWCNSAHAFQDDNPFATDSSDSDDDFEDLDDNAAVDDSAADDFLDEDKLESLDKSTQLIIRSMRSSNPTTPIQLARAVRTMVSVRQYEEARRYLKLLANLKVNSKQIYEMYQTIGADFFWDLAAEPALQPLGAQYSRLVSDIVEKEAFEPTRIEQLVKQLSDDNLDVRTEAFHQLRLLGAPAAAGMLNAINDPARDAEFGNIKKALRNLDDTAMLPLLAAARADGSAAQLAAVNALGNYSNTLSADTLCRVYLSPRVPQPTRTEAARSLRTLENMIPTVEQAQKRLYRRACQYLTKKNQLDLRTGSEVTFWVWDGASKMFAPRKIPKQTAQRIIGSDLARDVYELNPAIVQHRRIYLISILESQKRLVGPDVRIGFENLRRSIPDLTVGEVDQALASSMKMNLVAAAVGAAETLAEVGTADLLMTSDHSNLIKALTYGQRHLQFAALQAIALIDPQNAYVGSSYATKAAVYLAASRGAAATVVGHNRASVAQSQAAAFSPTGLSGRGATSSRELFKIATSDPDVEVIFITDTLDQPHYQELVQQLRSDWRTKRTPIGLLIDDQERSIRSQLTLQSDEFLQVLPLTQNEPLMFSQVNRLREFLDPWHVTNGQRNKHKAFAVEWLAKILLERQRYRFYDAVQYQHEIVQSLRASGNILAENQVLVAMGTPESQRALADFASEIGRPLEQRKVAAEAFGNSIKQHGTLLTTTELQLQYDRYNASEAESKDSQQVLASLLDAVEARAKMQNQ